LNNDASMLFLSRIMTEDNLVRGAHGVRIIIKLQDKRPGIRACIFVKKLFCDLRVGFGQRRLPEMFGRPRKLNHDWAIAGIGCLQRRQIDEVCELIVRVRRHDWRSLRVRQRNARRFIGRVHSLNIAV